MGKKSSKVYIVGHKNPDTDSICSAIAYAHLKREVTGNEYVARRAGQINEETHYVLQKFKVDAPDLLQNVKLQVKDMDIHKIDGIEPNVSIKDTWAKMKENNVKTIQLESKTMQEMLSKDFLPAVSRFAGEVSKSVLDKKALLPSIKAEKELALVESLTAAYETLSEGNDKLKALTEEVSSMESMQEAATFCHDEVLALMDELRVVADEAETRIPEKELPYPTYDQLLFSV